MKANASPKGTKRAKSAKVKCFIVSPLPGCDRGEVRVGAVGTGQYLGSRLKEKSTSVRRKQSIYMGFVSRVAFGPQRDGGVRQTTGIEREPQP